MQPRRIIFPFDCFDMCVCVCVCGKIVNIRMNTLMRRFFNSIFFRFSFSIKNFKMQKKVNHMMRCDAMMHTHTHKHKLLNNWITSQKCLPGLFIFSYQTYIRTHIWDVRECKLAFREFFFCSFHGGKKITLCTGSTV